MMTKTGVEYDDFGVDDDPGVENDENDWCWRDDDKISCWQL